MNDSCIRITTLACAGILVAACAVSGCGPSHKQARAARATGYDTDFAVVYRETLAAVRSIYPTMQEEATTGLVQTSWHEVRSGNADDGPYTRDFVRFEVHVVGGRPWRVRVHGQAARWDFQNAMPAPLEGGDEPPWLQGRVDALQLAIHQRLAQHAVVIGDRPGDRQAGAGARAAVAKPVADASRFGNLPPGAAQAAARVLAAVQSRDFDALAATMHPEFVWSLGAPPGAQAALALWQADSSALAALQAVLEAGCRETGAGDDENDGEVVCPVEPSAEPGGAGYRASFAPGPGGDWRMRAFVPGD